VFVLQVRLGAKFEGHLAKHSMRALNAMQENKMEKSIEQTFQELEQMIEKLESSEISLEESFASYEAGMKLVKACGEKIDLVEKQMLVLQEGSSDGDE